MPGLSERDRIRIAAEHIDPPPEGARVRVKGTARAWYRGKKGTVSAWFVNAYGPTFEEGGAMKPTHVEFGRDCWVAIDGAGFRVAVHPRWLDVIA